MTPEHGIRGRVMASALALALILPSFATAQDPPLPPAVPNHSQTSEPPTAGPDVADPSAAPANPRPADQLPDSPGSMQRTPNPEIAPPLAPVNGTTDSRDEPTSNPSASRTPMDSTVQSDPQAEERTTDRQQESRQTPGDSVTQPQQQSSPHEPRGTAAAESIQTTGVAASRPAGAAVAPAKQRRVRSILIKVGALVGVGVAVGTAMALSQGSPSRPPGSR